MILVMTRFVGLLSRFPVRAFVFFVFCFFHYAAHLKFKSNLIFRYLNSEDKNAREFLLREAHIDIPPALRGPVWREILGIKEVQAKVTPCLFSGVVIMICVD